MVAMPHSLNLEVQVLGCMMNNDDCALEGKEFCNDLFYDFEHQRIFNTMKKMVETNKTIDINLLIEEVRKEKNGLTGAELAYLMDVCQKSALSHNFEDYVNELTALRRKRTAIQSALNLSALVEKMMEILRKTSIKPFESFRGWNAQNRQQKHWEKLFMKRSSWKNSKKNTNTINSIEKPLKVKMFCIRDFSRWIMSSMVYTPLACISSALVQAWAKRL